MGWTSIFDLLNKFVPGREERIRNDIDRIKAERERIIKHEPSTLKNIERLAILESELHTKERALQNR